MWIADDDGRMFNLDHFDVIMLHEDTIKLYYPIINIENDEDNYCCYGLNPYLESEDILDRYYDLMKKLTGERPDE